MMKKLLVLLTLFLSFSLNAQFSVVEDSVYAEYDTNEEDVAVHNFQVTSTPTTTVKWKLLSVDVPSTWENDASICDAVSCYDSTTNSNQYDLVDNKNAALDVHFLNNKEVGEGKAKLLIWDVNDSMSTVTTVTYVAKVNLASSIKSIENINVSIFPNPVTKFINVNNVDLSTITGMEIFNIIGKKVYQSENVMENNKIDLQNFDNGIYILKLLDKNNNTYYTQNIIKK